MPTPVSAPAGLASGAHVHNFNQSIGNQPQRYDRTLTINQKAREHNFGAPTAAMGLLPPHPNGHVPYHNTHAIGNPAGYAQAMGRYPSTAPSYYTQYQPLSSYACPPAYHASHNPPPTLPANGNESTPLALALAPAPRPRSGGRPSNASQDDISVLRPVKNTSARVSKPRQRRPPRQSQAATRRQRGTNRLRDEENLEIAKLRVLSLLDWPDIVKVMNNGRRSRGMEPIFTDAAVYGRFKRNGPTLFERNGLGRFDPGKYMHLKNARNWVDPQGRITNLPSPAISSHPAIIPPIRRAAPGLFVSHRSESTEFDSANASESEHMDNRAGGDNDSYHPPVDHTDPSHAMNVQKTDKPQPHDHDANGDPDDGYHHSSESHPSPAADPAKGQPGELHRWFAHAMGAIMVSSKHDNSWREVAEILTEQQFNVNWEWCKSYYYNQFLVGTPSDPTYFPDTTGSARPDPAVVAEVIPGGEQQ